MQAIERDLVRWGRGKWLAAVLSIFALQIGLFIWASQKEVQKRAIYPSEPKISFAASANVLKRGFFEMENPFLFAAASSQGFSGEAWLRAPAWRLPTVGRRVAPNYLASADARKITQQQDADQSFALVATRRTSAQLPAPKEPAQVGKPSSELRLEGFNRRTLAAPLALPVQYHSDVLSSTVVEATIGRDGLVISARIIENSGSAQADAEALALARSARFQPVNTAESVAVVGKLIFEWFALSLSHTNSVTR